VLFLDEVGLLSEALQAKLLTVIEDRRVRPLGRTDSEEIDVWIVTATNKDLRVEVRQGRFREDLYHRLAVLALRVPALRERREARRQHKGPVRDITAARTLLPPTPRPGLRPSRAA
jgi:transcriptional regulator with GAF, ATPase, and Fis domain